MKNYESITQTGITCKKILQYSLQGGVLLEMLVKLNIFYWSMKTGFHESPILIF